MNCASNIFVLYWLFILYLNSTPLNFTFEYYVTFFATSPLTSTGNFLFSNFMQSLTSCLLKLRGQNLVQEAIFIELLYPRFEKVGGILVYICPSVRPSPFLVKIFRQRFLNNHTSYNAHIWYAGWWRLVVSWDWESVFSSYSSLYLSNFLSFHTLMKSFVKDFLTTMQGRMLIFGMQVDDDLCVSWDWDPVFSCLFSPVFVQFSFLPYFDEWHFSSKISQEPRKLEGSYMVCMFMMTCCIVGLRTSLLLLILPYICPIFFPSILSRMKFFVKDFSRTIQARMLIFGMHVDDDFSYCGIEN